ncbi:two-component sensor histidine kinase protein [Alcanivorax sp. S71-1-4]|uniref:hybrid sensor histidine kinase/response regulator n=1 Tax=Alcanivorax sp. S71-1-4 TaxID=1177159 RepID=UPI00135B2BDD|nr:ATP-binding protein [Alcanivorax sp. S71-1-4]KAF0809052.1 two-component sensor histidine kinase protein [Alcanivorax sp. S71-1-4]
MSAQQRIMRVRRNYNKWVANQTLEDYALRFTAKQARRWSAARVSQTALGAISFLALEAIGAAITLSYGFTNAMAATVTVCALIFMLALPISYYAARFGVDVDLLTRGAGFGYLGSTLTSLIYASFTFIFFALEAAIMAMALQILFGLPVSIGYLVSSLMVIPLVTHGITFISRFQVWTQPLWLLLQLVPFVFILFQQPDSMSQWTGFPGHGDGQFNILLFGAACAVLFALVGQIGEQVDFLRFLPEQTPGKRLRWWGALLAGGPGWAVVGGLKIAAGSFLAVLALRYGLTPADAADPTHMYIVAFNHLHLNPAASLALAGIFVILCQLKINVTNAYAGSIAWSNFFSRLTHSHPGRVVWLVFNVLIALLLMEIGIYLVFEDILGTYALVAVAWIGALVGDLVVNKPLGLSPKHIEFRRAHLYDINPVGVGAMVLASLTGILASSGLFGELAKALAPFIALLTAFLAAPLIAIATRGRYYIARQPASIPLRAGCCICEHTFDREDMAFCPAYNGHICSLCCSLDARCNDSCKTGSRAQEQIVALLSRWLPERGVAMLRSRMGHFIGLLVLITALMAVILTLIYYQLPDADAQVRALMATTLAKVFAVLLIISGVIAWLFVLAHESRVVAQEESRRQTAMLMDEIAAHEKTDRALQKAKEQAEAANQAKSRYLTGLSHELRSPLNAAFGYAQLLEHDPAVPAHLHDAVAAIRRSTSHLADLIEGLLEISKIEAGRLELDRNQVRIHALIDELVSMFRLQASEKGIGFRFVCTTPVPELVTADEKRLRQILINLLSNAIKFTRQGEVALHFRYRNQVAEFTIRDTGVGIAQEDIERIFLPFERVRKAGTPATHGTGLGLTITRLLTEIMGGDLSVQSTPGQGSEFRLSLMLSSLPYRASPTVALAPVGYHGAPRTLLVIDDDPTHRGLISDMLTPLGFTILEAPDGPAGLAMARQSQPHLVLLDIAMPGMDGWQVAAALREGGYRGPVIMVSANAGGHALPGSQSAHDDYLVKPYRLSALRALLDRHLTLNWRYDDTHAPTPRVDSTTLPPPVRDELVALAEIGHLAALRQAMARHTALIPAPLSQALADALGRCDFARIIQLMEQPHDTASV